MRLSDGTVLLDWPLAQHVLTAGYLYNDGSPHNAIDLRAPVGTPVYAAEDGTVDWVQNWDGRTTTGTQSYGNALRIRHASTGGRSLQTRYAHLSQVLVQPGDRVRAGQLIGYSGDSGNVSGPHLHFEVILDGCAATRWCGWTTISPPPRPGCTPTRPAKGRSSAPPPPPPPSRRWCWDR